MDLRQLESKIAESFAQITHPIYRITLKELDLRYALTDEGENFRLIIKTPDQDRKMQIELESMIRKHIGETPKKLKIRFEFDESIKPVDEGRKIRGIKNILLIGSGKGGVGKSTVTSNLAAAMALKGLKVGILDSDIYGPSVGKLYGLPGKQGLDGDGGNRIYPVTAHGVKLMSFAFILEEDQAVIWRGPMLGKAVEQLLFDVLWGELDYLLIDLPPGTGDVQMSIAQLVDVDGAIIVSTPQNVALQDATRAATMFFQMKVPILGIVENMSEFVCPKCGHVSHIFSKKGVEDFSEKHRVPKLGSIPLQQAIMESGEEGKPLVLAEEGAIRDAYVKILEKVIEEVERYKV